MKWQDKYYSTAAINKMVVGGLFGCGRKIVPPRDRSPAQPVSTARKRVKINARYTLEAYGGRRGSRGEARREEVAVDDTCLGTSDRPGRCGRVIVVARRRVVERDTLRRPHQGALLVCVAAGRDSLRAVEVEVG